MQTCIWPTWCHCHSLSLHSPVSVKSRLVLPFLSRLTRVVPIKRSLNGCLCVRIQLFIIVCYITCQQCPLLVCQCSLSRLVSQRLADRCGHFLMSWEVFLDNSVNGDNQSQLNSSMHYYECIALCKDISLQWGWFCTGSLSSCIPRSSEDRSSWMFFIQVVRGHPGGRLQFSGGGSKMAWIASAFSSIRARCPEKVRWWDLMMDESGWLIGNVGISEWW